MLALLQLIGQHVDPLSGALDKSTLKAVYVAPMKALAQEVVEKFTERLAPLGLQVRELTGDTQLSRAEVEATHLIVTTPEKWDVITRKGGTDGSLATRCKLVIVDEVHLLADERGAVIESIVARTMRLVESAQTTVRVVALSATLPNYQDVALFLRVNVSRGLFFFGPEYRPVPLDQTYLGVAEKNRMKLAAKQNERAFEVCLDAVRRGHQVMVFVHARKDTVRTAQAIRDFATKDGCHDDFSCALPDNPNQAAYELFGKQVSKSKNAELRELFASGFLMHHAGMLRPDRTLVERAFAAGAAKVLVCTATLAWGVNLPAHSVVIKGTQVYDPAKGGNVDLSMLDVMQIFGRAGRPQYDTSGEATMITSAEALPRYLALLGHQSPIESNFLKSLPDHLNAEVASGTVTSVDEAVAWLSYTYLFVRMLKNPLAYGLTFESRSNDPNLNVARFDKVCAAAKLLDERRMLRFDPRSGNLAVTDLGRTASHFYIQNESIGTFNDLLRPYLSDSAALDVLCRATEFEQVKVRPEELVEMDKLAKGAPLEVRAPLEESAGKVSVLLQCYVSQLRPTSFTLISDTNYCAQNGARVARALFEVALRKGLCSLATCFLRLAKSIDRRCWWWETPVRQIASDLKLPDSVVAKLEAASPSLDQLLDMDAQEVGQLVRHERLGYKVLAAAQSLPKLACHVEVQPMTRAILRLTVTLTLDFNWDPRLSGTLEPFWVWVGDSGREHVYHSEAITVPKPRPKRAVEPIVLSLTVPCPEPLPSQYLVHVLSDRWVGIDEVHTVSFRHLVLPDQHPPHTDLLMLTPLPVNALQHVAFEDLYAGKLTHFNPIQTQVFHTLYRTDRNVLLGAPTSSGKTLVAELALLRVLNQRHARDASAPTILDDNRDPMKTSSIVDPEKKGKDALLSQSSRGGGGSTKHKSSCKSKIVYVAPLKALARERMKDWRTRLGGQLGLVVLELTGDVTPDPQSLRNADVIITTPEKWDGVSRGWRSRDYVQAVELVIIDEIHLLGEERGAVLEVIVSRMRHMAASLGNTVRLLGLSTALANAQDLGDWLGVDPRPGRGLYNFRPSVRPVPMEVHIRGFPGQHYCPRMGTMNKPTYSAILEHSPKNPVLVFVASRRQTRLTALDLISFCAAADHPKQWLHMGEEEAEAIAETCTDEALKHTLGYGVGLHHAGLNDHDRSVVEELFVHGRIQVLVCTSTLAWGVNFPARLVVVKGTEFFDGKQGR
jgi:activating signal cointegrator complex subunit 3